MQRGIDYIGVGVGAAIFNVKASSSSPCGVKSKK